MVLSRPFRCPTQVFTGLGHEAAVGDLVAGRRWALATSPGWPRRGAVDALVRACGRPLAVIDQIPVNPTVSAVVGLADGLPPVDVVVALGGGSVIDCAKGLVGFQALGRDRGTFMAHLRDGAELPEDFAPAPVIAVPTTSGTGSEVTRWATIWGDEKVKFSLTHPALYPSHAVLDPALCLSMPAEVTLASGLDAVSHAMESVWNRNHTALSDEFAAAAIGRIRTALPRVMAAPADLAARGEMQLAALLAGFAMGTTQTALAHSISYPFTARFGMPHGFACSFTLAEVARYNAEAGPARVAIAARAFGCAGADLPEALAAWLEDLGLGEYVAAYVAPEAVDGLGDGLITRARAANNLREADGDAARGLARRSLERLAAAAPPAARTAAR